MSEVVNLKDFKKKLIEEKEDNTEESFSFSDLHDVNKKKEEKLKKERLLKNRKVLSDYRIKR